ncbi:histidine phosphatase family protein [Cytophagaceae bacterium ABcell3]|nr:histidine phosphatase family protein [Cytophagaceae bacterium ABcell3]
MRRMSIIALFSIFITVWPVFASIQEHQSSNDIKSVKQTYKSLRDEASYVYVDGKEVARRIRFVQPEDNVVEDYDKLQQIALIRHGEPDLYKSGRFSRDEAVEYMLCYDTACIIKPDAPFFMLKEQEEVKVFASPLNRALSTAHYVCGPDKEITVSRDFREFETYLNAKGKKPRLRMPIKYWTTTARIKWALGFKAAEGVENYSQAKKRARKAARTLVESAEENHKSMLFGHGMLNHYIKKELEKMGWQIVEDTGNDYFGTSILVKINS